MSLSGRKLSEGYNVETSLQGISFHLPTDLCMEKLCFNDLSTEIDIQGEQRCHPRTSSLSVFRARGKVLTSIPSLSAGNILSIPRHQVVEFVFPPDTDQVSANFEAKVNLFNISPASNVTLRNNKLSFEMQGEIFRKYMTNVIVRADTNNVEDWSALRFVVYGRMANSSQLPKSLQTKVADFAKYLAEKASRKVQNVENSLLQAEQRVNVAMRSVKEKQLLLKNAERIKRRKYAKLQGSIMAYAEAKMRLNSSLVQFLHRKYKQICEYKNCSYIDTKTCIPTVCQSPIRVSYVVPNCQKRQVTYVEHVVETEEVEETEAVQTYLVVHHSDCGDAGKSLGGVATAMDSVSAVTAAVGAPVVSAIASGVSTVLKITAALSDSIFGCDSYHEKVPGPVKYVKHKVLKHKPGKKEVPAEVYDCNLKPKEESVFAGYNHSYECCKNERDGKIQVLDPECVSHNTQCWRNMNFSRKETEIEQKDLELYEFKFMTEKAQKAAFAQLGMSKARVNYDIAVNQLKIARAFLEQHEYAKNSVNITKITSREKLGLELSEKLKRTNGKALVTVGTVEFFVSVTSSSTKTRFPVTASLKTADGTDESLEFSMDFTNENRSLTIAARLIIEAIFGTSRSRRRRSAKQDLTLSGGAALEESSLSLEQRECLFSREAHVFFSDVIESVELFIENTKDLEEAMVASLRGLEKLDFEGNNNYGPAREMQSPFDDTVQSIKKTYLNGSITTRWNTSLDDLRAFLEILSKGKDFSDCSGIQDCIEFFCDSLGDMYEMEDHPRAIEIKYALKEIEKLITRIVTEAYSMATLQSLISQTKALVIKSKDDIILCSKKPSIVRNSPVEVVTTIGETIQLECEAASPIELVYLWYKNGKPLEDTNTTILKLSNVTRESGGAYHCQVSNSRGSSMSNVTILEVHQKPQINQQPQDAQVLTGEEMLSLVCNSTGVPRPKTEWFFIPINGASNAVVGVNTTNSVLEMYNLSFENAGLYYCNVSNPHGTVQSRKARIDILDFAPGVPRIAVEVGLKFCEDSTRPAQQLNLAAFNYVWKQLIEVLSWPSGNIESPYFNPFPKGSISFVLNGDDASVSGDFSPAERLETALKDFSMSRIRMGKSLKKLYTVLADGSFRFEWENKKICVDKDRFAIGFLPQICPNGTKTHKNGFLCVNCAPGYYGVANGTCLQCPSGTYQPEEGRTECIRCPFQRSSTEAGAFWLSQCVDMSVRCRPPVATTKNAQYPNKLKQLYLSGENIELRCRIGYKGIGNSTQECNDKGNWTTTDFYCKKTCLPPWTELRKRCYKVTALSTNKWKDASAKCQSLQSHMLTLSSEEENDFAASLVKAYLRKNNLRRAHMWLGLFKAHSNGEFRWVDGSPFGNYSNWSPGEPSNDRGKELCTEMLVFGNYVRLKKWNDVSCDRTRYKALTVCEKPIREGD